MVRTSKYVSFDGMAEIRLKILQIKAKSRTICDHRHKTNICRSRRRCIYCGAQWNRRSFSASENLIAQSYLTEAHLLWCVQCTVVDVDIH